MPIQVQVDDELLEFPDDMSDSDIESVLRKEFPSTPQGPTLSESLNRPPLEIPYQPGMPYGIMPQTPAGVRPAPEAYEQQVKSEQSPIYRQALEGRHEGVLSAAGLTPESVPSGQRLTDSVVGLSPEWGNAFRKEVPSLRALDVPLTVASSVAKTGIGIGEYLSSPQGVTEFVASMTPAKLLVLGKWALDMGKGAYQEGAALGKLLAKENKTPEDFQAVSDHTVNALALGLGSGFTGKRAIGEVRTLAKKLNMPEGKFRVEDRGSAAQDIFNRFELERQIEAGSPFVRSQPPASPVSMGTRTQPNLSVEFDSRGRVIGETFDPSGMKMLEVPPEVQTGFQSPKPPSPIAPAPSTGRASQRVRLQGEAAQRAADWEKAMSEKVAQDQAQPAHPDKPLTENQLRIIQDSLRAAVADNQLSGRRPGLISDGALEAWADKVFKDAKDQNLRFSGGDTKMLAAGIIKGAAILERGVVDIAKWSAEMVKEYGESIRPYLYQIHTEVQRLKNEPGKAQATPEPTPAPAATEKTTEPALRPDPPVPESEFPPFPKPGNRLITIQRRDGTTYRAGLDEKQSWPKEVLAPGLTGEVVHRVTLEDGKPWWSTGMLDPGEKIVTRGKESKPATIAEPVVESVTALDPSSGSPLSGMDSLINRLESLKFPEVSDAEWLSRGTELSSGLNLPHPDVIKAVGREAWNRSVDLTIEGVKAGKSAAEAIEEAVKFAKGRPGFNEEKFRANLQHIATLPSSSPPPAERPTTKAVSAATIEVKDPITGETAKLITEKAARAMESKVKIPAEADVKKLAEQMNLFSKEIGDALETGGQFLAKDLRPDVAKGAPAERGTVTSKEVNQYFVNKLSSIRKQMQATKQKISRQADVDSFHYFDVLQERFEIAFRQVQELRRASHESLYFWNKIKAEYQDIARAAGEMPEMKKQMPVLDQVWKDFREKKPGQAGSHFVDFLRMNQFTPGSWTLDFGTNLVATATKLPAWAIMDMAAMVTGRAPTRMFSAVRSLADNMKNWNPLGKRFRLPEQIESELGNTAGGEFGGRSREVFFDFSEILRGRPELAEKLRHLDKVAAAPVRMKRAVDGFFGRFGAAAELYNRAYMEGKTRGMKGDELKTFVEEFVQNPPEAAIGRAVKTGKELKFNRDLTKWEEAYASNILTKLVVEAFPRWTLQFIRWGGEMVGANPVFFRDLVTGKATPEQAVHYLTKAATGWGGLYAFNQLFYDNIDANSMEYVKEDGNRVRLSGRTPAPELFFIVAMLRGDTEKAKAALAHLSVPGAKLLSGEPAGIISPLVDTIRESIRGRYTAEQTIRELTKLVNDTIPGKTVLGFIRSIYDPSIREGIGAPIPGLASRLPQRVNPTTGEPLAPKTRIPGTKIELPSVGGTPFPGAERVLNDIEKALLNHGLGNTRPRRTSIIDLPAEDVPKDVRREYEKLVGQNVKEFIGAEIQEPDFKELPFEVRREVLQQLLTNARAIARADIAEKYGASGESVQSTPLNIQRMPERLRK